MCHRTTDLIQSGVLLLLWSLLVQRRVTSIFSWASQIVCRRVSHALFTEIQHPFILAWLPRRKKKKKQEVGRGCVMYIIGNQISWVPSSCFLSETTCPLNWKPECNCHISSQRVPHFAACLANKPQKMFCIADRRAALSGESLERPSLLWAEIFSLK